MRADFEPEALQVHIDVRLPASTGEAVPLRIKKLRTYLPQYKHHFGDLAGSVSFDEVDVVSDIGEVVSEV